MLYQVDTSKDNKNLSQQSISDIPLHAEHYSTVNQSYAAVR
jgi:hypothetical protein